MKLFSPLSLSLSLPALFALGLFFLNACAEDTPAKTSESTRVLAAHHAACGRATSRHTCCHDCADNAEIHNGCFIKIHKSGEMQQGRECAFLTHGKIYYTPGSAGEAYIELALQPEPKTRFYASSIRRSTGITEETRELPAFLQKREPLCSLLFFSPEVIQKLEAVFKQYGYTGIPAVELADQTKETSLILDRPCDAYTIHEPLFDTSGKLCGYSHKPVLAPLTETRATRPTFVTKILSLEMIKELITSNSIYDDSIRLPFESGCCEEEAH